MINDKSAVLITGATSGLGRNSAYLLGASGRTVVVHGRRVEAVHEVVEEIRSNGGNALPFVADLSDLREVDSALADFPDISLHGIMANAGIICRRTETYGLSAQGFDMTFAVNVLGHQLIFLRLAERILKGGRIVVTTSEVHDPKSRLARFSRVPEPKWAGVKNLAYADHAPAEFGLTNGFLRYSTSKLLNIFQARVLQEEFRNIDVFAFNPGFMVDTSIARELPRVLRPVVRIMGKAVSPFFESVRLSTDMANNVRDLFENEKWDHKGFAYVDGGVIGTPSEDALREDWAQELWAGTLELIEKSLGS